MIRIVTMSILRRVFRRSLAPLGACARGISVLDVLLAVLVLTVVLLAAANQFGRYEQAAAPAASEQSADPTAAEQ